MNVLITGGGGFIGSHLVDSQLNQGHHVRTIDLHVGRLDHTKDHPHLEIVVGDITDAVLIRLIVEGIDIVYHLASAHLDVRLSDNFYHHVNVDATRNLLVSARDAGVNRFVHCSSVGVIGDVDNPPADETTPCHPTNIYEQTKLDGELAVLEFSRQTDFDVVVARPAWVYGPRCPRTAKLVRTIKNGRFIFFGNGRNLRHPIYISEVIRGLELCAEVYGVKGEIYIIAGEQPVTTAELVETIAQTLKVKPPSIHLPIILGRVVGYAVEVLCKPLGKQPPYSRRSLDFFVKNNSYDIGKSNRELGFNPQIDLSRGIQYTLDRQYRE